MFYRRGKYETNKKINFYILLDNISINIYIRYSMFLRTLYQILGKIGSSYREM